jgi:nucleoid-associated protein YgaU
LRRDSEERCKAEAERSALAAATLEATQKAQQLAEEKAAAAAHKHEVTDAPRERDGATYNLFFLHDTQPRRGASKMPHIARSLSIALYHTR